MRSSYDVAIVGAGPAGSSLAIRLATAGKKVVLIEKEKFPRPKLCGEFISPECLDHFADLGVLPEIRTAGAVELKETVFYARNGRGVAVPSSMFGGGQDAALGLSRAEMDLRLMVRAKEVGVEVREGTIATEPKFERKRVRGLNVRTGGAGEEIAAPLVVDATGRARLLLRKAGAEQGSRATLVAFRAHVRNVDIPGDRCEIFSYRRGYGGTSRVEGGFYNLCFIASAADVKRCGSDAQRVFKEIVCSNKRAAHIFRNVEVSSAWLAVPIERFGRGSLSPAPGLVAVGDAAAFIDPFTGSGMLLAFQSAQLAAECILASSSIDQVAAAYEERYQALFERRLQICAWLRRASLVPYLAEMIILGLSWNSGLKKRLVRATRIAGST